MGTFKVNGDISATGTISASSFLGNASTSSIPLGFSYRETSWTWGTLTAANGYTLLTDWITPATGRVAFADKGTQVSCQIDGYFYQDEGRYIVLDANNYTSYAPTKTGSGASGTWGINITGSAATASSASSASLLSIHNSITNTSTRSTFASTWTGGISGLKYVWGQSWKDTSISSDPGDLVLGLRPAQYSSGTELCMMIDGDYYAMGNKVLHAGNISSYAAPISHTHSAIGDGTMTIVAHENNEVNFGGSSSNGTQIYFGYRAVDNKPIPSTFIFGGSSGSASIKAAGGTMTGHLYATSGLSWNHSYWTPNGNIYCQPTGNGQEWSFDVGASGYTGCYWHVWSAKNGCSMLRCDADNNAVGIPNGPLYLGSSCYGPNLPGASYVGQIFFKT